MADRELELNVLRDLLGATDVLTDLTRDQAIFNAAFDAFRREDGRAFTDVLTKAQLQLSCHLVCEWVRSKECIFLCLDLAGPPVATTAAPDPRVLAGAIAKLAGDEKLLQRLADVVTKRDPGGFTEILKRLEITPYAHIFCHWVCSIRYRLVCRYICHWQGVERPQLWLELQSAALAVGDLYRNERAFRGAVAAATADDGAKLGAIVRGAGLQLRCHWICEWFCSWRCVLVCLTLSRPYPFKVLPLAEQPREAYAFAQACVRLAENPAVLRRLSAAVGAGNLDQWAALLKEFKLEPYALQLCHWICGWRCRYFCKLSCPDPHYYPWFTHVGNFNIETDIDLATGLTKWARSGLYGPHGGPNFGFFGNLTLRGFCPKHDPAHLSEQMAYRFIIRQGGSDTPVAAALVAPVQVGTRLAFWKGAMVHQTVYIRNVAATSPTPPTPDPNPLAPVPEHVIAPTAEGWVTVDLEALDDAFSGDLMGFATGALFGDGAPNPGVLASQAVPVPAQRAGHDCDIVFQATRVSTLPMVNSGSAPDYSNHLAKCHINNWGEVSLLNLLQFHSGPVPDACSPLTNALDIEYTVDHELIAGWSVGLSSASGRTLTNAPPLPPIAPSTGTFGVRGGFGVHHEDTSAWAVCSYTVTLTTQRRLTDGLSDDPSRPNSITFCIDR